MDDSDLLLPCDVEGTWRQGQVLQALLGRQRLQGLRPAASAGQTLQASLQPADGVGLSFYMCVSDKGKLSS